MVSNLAFEASGTGSIPVGVVIKKIKKGCDEYGVVKYANYGKSDI